MNSTRRIILAGVRNIENLTVTHIWKLLIHPFFHVKDLEISHLTESFINTQPTSHNTDIAAAADSLGAEQIDAHGVWLHWTDAQIKRRV